MVTDTTVTPNKKLEGAALTTPDARATGDARSTEQQLADQFKEGLDPEQGELAKLTAGMADLGYVEGGGPIDATIVDKALLALRGVQADRDEATARAEKAEASLKRAKAKVSAGDKPAKPRALKAMDDSLTGADLREAIDDAETVEIAFSDGEREIAGLAPIKVEGEVWREHALGLMLRDPVTLHGPSEGTPGYRIDGYALLIDGKPVAYRKRSDPIVVAAGTKQQIADDIIF